MCIACAFFTQSFSPLGEPITRANYTHLPSRVLVLAILIIELTLASAPTARPDSGRVTWYITYSNICLTVLVRCIMHGSLLVPWLVHL
jgi:hypothetical protein